MIVLTQEQREKRIDWLKQRISSMEQCRDEIPFGLGEDESMELSTYKDSLVSLTAECKYFQWKWTRDENAVWTTTPIEKLSDAVSVFSEDGENVTYRMLFTAPPVPEIKDHEVREMVNEITSTAVKYSGCQCLRDAISKVVIKRLNGLGE